MFKAKPQGGACCKKAKSADELGGDSVGMPCFGGSTDFSLASLLLCLSLLSVTGPALHLISICVARRLLC